YCISIEIRKLWDKYFCNNLINIAGINYVWEVIAAHTNDFKQLRHVICPNCEEKLGIKNLLINDEEKFKRYVIKKTAKMINMEIAYCSDCCPSYISHFSGPLLTNDLLDNYDIPDNLQDEIFSYLVCRCGSAEMDGYYIEEEIGEFEMYRIQYMELGGEDDEDYEQDFDGEELQEEFDENVSKEKIHVPKTPIFNLSTKEQNDFIDYLWEYPLMGLHHEVGKKIFAKLSSPDLEGLSELQTGTQLYRSRERDPIERHAAYINSEMWAPGFGIPSQGRYNPVGVPVLYLADAEETCIEEIQPEEDNLVEFATFVLLEPIKVWDISDTDLHEILSTPSINIRKVSKEYILPNFIAQCCSLAGIAGIKYESVKNPNGYNLALFKYTEGHSIAISKIYTSDYLSFS
ncbi:TPA: RES family NAD+ phosphorylase, partial [Bacillus cereus]|nr:RES family NAD+ phosphorylase [Bacillus cereus]